MVQQLGKSEKRGKPSFIYSIVSVTMVLFLLGALGVLLLNARQITQNLKENVELSVILNDDLGESQINNFTAELNARKEVLATRYISKQQAAEEFKEEYGEDFLALLDFNPLYGSLQMRLHSEYGDKSKIELLKKELEANRYISEVFYQENLVDAINDNIGKLSLVLGIITALLLFIAISLIDNTIKLSMYSNRFLIKSMQMVGATRSFITKPFIQQSLLNGLASGVAACVLLGLLVWYLGNQLPIVDLAADWKDYLFIAFSVVLIGLVISFLSTRTAVLKYLKMRLEDLY